MYWINSETLPHSYMFFCSFTNPPVCSIPQIYTHGDTFGPLFEYGQSSVNIWIHTSPSSLHFHANVRFDRTRIAAFSVETFRANRWDFIVISYNHSSGVLKAYRDEIEIHSGFLEPNDLRTQRTVRIGARGSGDIRCLHVRVSCYQLYNYAMEHAQLAQHRYRCQDTIGRFLLTWHICYVCLF